LTIRTLQKLIEVIYMHMKTGVEQSVYAIILLNMLPDKAVLSGEAISQQLGTSATYFQKLLRKLVSADLITSVPGVKGGFKLKKKPGDIRIYDIYLAVEGQQSLYSSSGILNDMLELKEEDQCCLLTDLMEEAESSWKSILKRETVASYFDEIHKGRFKTKMEFLQTWINEKMVL
jgi:Rrf2 family protein